MGPLDDAPQFDPNQVVIREGAPPWVVECVLLLASLNLVRITLERDDCLAGARGDNALLERARHVQAILTDTLNGFRDFFARIDDGKLYLPLPTYTRLVSAYNGIADLQHQVKQRAVPFFGKGNPLADLFILSDKDMAENGKLSAAESLARGLLRNPIPPQRWRALEPGLVGELHRRGEDRGQSPETVMHEVVVQAIFLAIAWEWKPLDTLCFMLEGKRRKLTDFGGRNEPAFFPWWLYWTWLRQEVADLVCEDLLGPSYRGSYSGRESPLAEAEPISKEDAQKKIEAHIELQEMIQSLAPSEQRLAELLLEGYSLVDAARELGWAASTARNAWRRIKKKAGRV